MTRRWLALVFLVLGLVVAAALVITTSRYRHPGGAATGEAGGCGGDPTEFGPDGLLGEDTTIAAEEPTGEGPAQLIYRRLEGGKVCLEVIVEPTDRVATVDDLCSTSNQQPVVLDLDDALAKQLLAGYQQLAESSCTEEECPPGARVEVLTQEEQTLFLPYASPLRESLEVVMAEAAGKVAPPPAPATHSVTLGADEGAIFVDGSVLKAASPLQVDLIGYASSKTVDLQAGAGPTITKQKHLKLFRTPGGTVATFGSIDELPDELPVETDRDMVHHAQAGTGFVVENNVSPGHTRAFVQSADENSVTLVYRLVEE